MRALQTLLSTDVGRLFATLVVVAAGFLLLLALLVVAIR
jgi:hypothetical protein